MSIGRRLAEAVETAPRPQETADPPPPGFRPIAPEDLIALLEHRLAELWGTAPRG